MNGKTGVFLDRDGTVIVDVGYLDDPERIELLPGAVESIQSLNECGIPVILLSNQSGVARGMFTLEMATKIDRAVVEAFTNRGARITASYFCPHHPEADKEEFRTQCYERKPNPGMPQRAAQEHGIDLGKSFVVGDKLSDLQLAENIGAVGILVRTGEGTATEAALPNEAEFPVFDTISSAVGYILSTINMENCHVSS